MKAWNWHLLIWFYNNRNQFVTSGFFFIHTFSCWEITPADPYPRIMCWKHNLLASQICASQKSLIRFAPCSSEVSLILSKPGEVWYTPDFFTSVYYWSIKKSGFFFFFLSREGQVRARHLFVKWLCKNSERDIKKRMMDEWIECFLPEILWIPFPQQRKCQIFYLIYALIY